MPTPDYVYEESHDLDLGGRVVRLQAVGRAHSKGDQVITVPDADVLCTGDLAAACRIKREVGGLAPTEGLVLRARDRASRTLDSGVRPIDLGPTCREHRDMAARGARGSGRYYRTGAGVPSWTAQTQ